MGVSGGQREKLQAWAASQLGNDTTDRVGQVGVRVAPAWGPAAPPPPAPPKGPGPWPL